MAAWSLDGRSGTFLFFGFVVAIFGAQLHLAGTARDDLPFEHVFFGLSQALLVVAFRYSVFESWSGAKANWWLWLLAVWAFVSMGVGAAIRLIMNWLTPLAPNSRSAPVRTLALVGAAASTGWTLLTIWLVRSALGRGFDVSSRILLGALAAFLIAAAFWLGASFARRRGQVFRSNEHSLVLAWGEEQVVTEVWFRGNHTDIGGGGTEELCAAAFQWICAEALAADPPLVLSTDKLPEVKLDGSAVASDKFAPFIALSPRPILRGDKIHASVDPTGSADERLRRRLGYRLSRPVSLVRPYPPRNLELTGTRSADGYRELEGFASEGSSAVAFFNLVGLVLGSGNRHIAPQLYDARSTTTGPAADEP